MLVPLGSGHFRVRETGTLVERNADVLVVVTTNEERDLPPAFVRRCVVYYLASPLPDHLVRIAAAHAEAEGAPLSQQSRALAQDIAELTERLQQRARELKLRPPGVAEYLDTVRACVDLGIGLDDPRWRHVKSMTLAKDALLQ